MERPLLVADSVKELVGKRFGVFWMNFVDQAERNCGQKKVKSGKSSGDESFPNFSWISLLWTTSRPLAFDILGSRQSELMRFGIGNWRPVILLSRCCRYRYSDWRSVAIGKDEVVFWLAMYRRHISVIL